VKSVASSRILARARELVLHPHTAAETRYLHPMTGWAPIILTALGSGALGSIITTYGTQTRERRQARAQAREAIRQVQNLTVPVPTHEQLTTALDNLETSAMLARLPRRLTGLNREALYIRRDVMASVSEADHPTTQNPPTCTATWHSPLNTSRANPPAPHRCDLASHPRRALPLVAHSPARPRYGHTPRPGPDRRGKRRWERETIRKAKQELKHRRQAS
jgi:hypothetical protein